MYIIAVYLVLVHMYVSMNKHRSRNTSGGKGWEMMEWGFFVSIMFNFIKNLKYIG